MYFIYNPRINNHQYKLNDIYNDEIKLLTEIYKEISIKQLSINWQLFNLQKFNFYVEVIKNKGDKKNASTLFEVMANYIYSDKFYWDGHNTEQYGSVLKGLGYVISQQNEPIQTAKNLINKFKIIHQGWNPSKINDFSLVKESFICSGIVFLFENESSFKNKKEKESFFKELRNHLLTQHRFSQFDTSGYYQISLQLLFLLTNQFSSDIKEYYEQELINNYDNLYSLLAILSNDKIQLLDDSKNDLI